MLFYIKCTMTVIEASPVKFYLAKFFFLAVAFIQWLIAATLLIQLRFTNQDLFISFIFFVLGFVFFYIFLLVNDKVKRVAVGKNKIVIIEGDRNSRFSWPEVKSVKNIPFINLYKLKLRGKKKPIYFFSSKEIEQVGLIDKGLSKSGEVAKKKKGSGN